MGLQQAFDNHEAIGRKERSKEPQKCKSWYFQPIVSSPAIHISSCYVRKINFYLFRPLLIGFPGTSPNTLISDLLCNFLCLKYELLEVNERLS